MGSGSERRRGEPSSGGTPEPDDDVRVLLFMGPGRDRELLVETLGERYRVETTTDVEALDSAFDCCVFDEDEFGRVTGTVQSKRELSSPVFLPFVLLVSDRSGGSLAENVWDYVDDVIELPVRRTALVSRIENLVGRRRTSLKLGERERRLAETVSDLKLKEQAMDEAPVGITLAESGDGDDDPLAYINAEFEELTGYGSGVLGDDCRLLQGEDTDPETKATLRAAIDAEEPVSVDVLNYRSNGRKFWNSLTVAPLDGDDGEVTHYVGFQTDITDRKIRERRLEVMNRVLNHNLRNKMNLIEGYTTLLRQELPEGEYEKPLEVMESTTGDLMGLAEAVRKIDHTLSTGDSDGATIELGERIRTLLSRFTDQYPDATFDLSLPDDDGIEVDAIGLLTAIEEGMENAIKHNDGPDPTVEIRVERPSADWIEIEIEDDGPGIPEHETHVLDRGETSLNHADRLGIWLMYWVVNRAGGEFSVSTDESTGTTVRLRIPTSGG